MTHVNPVELVRQRQALAQARLVEIVIGNKDIAKAKSVANEIEALKKVAAALPSPRSYGILKLVAVGFLILLAVAIGFMIRISPGRTTIDAIVTDFEAGTLAAKGTANGKAAETPALASSIEVRLGSLSLSGATINRRAYRQDDASELEKITSLTEFGAYSSSTRFRISTARTKCYELTILDGDWRATASRVAGAGAGAGVAAFEIGLPKDSEISFCSENIRLPIFGITWLGLHRPFADTLPPTYGASIVSGILQRERVSGDRKLTQAQRIELTGITNGIVELRSNDRIKMSFAGNAGRLCALQGIGPVFDGTCDDDLRPTLVDFFRQNALFAQILIAIAGIAGFLGALARFFGWRIPGIASMLLAGFLQFWQVEPAAAAQDARPFVLNNLVRLTVRLADGGAREGYGLVIGRKDDDIWLITAAHVVFKDDDKPFPASSISGIIGPPDCQTSAAAGAQPFKPGRTDVALLPLRVPLRIQPQQPALQMPPPQSSACELWAMGILSSDPVAGEELNLIGHDGRLEINAHTVRLTDSKAAAGPKGSIGIEGLATKEGDSGAAVASSRGVVGLYIGAIANAGYMVPIGTIREAISGLDTPWQLIVGSDPPPGSIRFCIQQTGPERPDIRLQGPTDVIRLDGAGCATGPRATLRVNVPNPELYACNPSRISPTKDNQAILISCSAKLDGYWRLGSTDGLMVSAINAQRWRINGLGTTPFGLLSGEVQGLGSEASGLVVSAMDSSVRLSVTLKGSTNALRISVETSSAHQVFDLTR
jgi:hypothetical protein